MKTIRVCCGTGCLANGSARIAEAFERLTRGTDVAVECDVHRTGCMGCCENGPLVTVLPDDISYYRVKESDVPEILEKTVGRGETVDWLLFTGGDGKKVRSQKENPFYAPQLKIALRNVGVIRPDSLDDYLARGGYEALKKALGMTPDEIITEIETSGLRGRGGAGFPTGRKWRTAAGYDVFPKYVVCNGDEGDPGAFMDGSILEGDPHSVLEGMAICALAIGSEEGILYIRDEYVQARKSIQTAIRAAEARGILGERVLGTDRRLRLSVVRGGGAFVCGESTALMQSIEGKVGEPRAKYIRSVQRGLWDHPTVLNNVETLANVPYILAHGGAHYASVGTEGSKGTKVFAMVGKVKRTGLVEVPMGATLRELIFDVGGGVQGGRPFKAVQTGGPSGGCLPKELLDTPVDYDNLIAAGSMMGSGGMIVMDEDNCMVDIARFFLDFTVDESCGKCAPCRIGTRRMLEILERIVNGKGEEGDIEKLENLANTIKATALCGLGQTAPNPVLSTLKFFRHEYEAHIKEKKCPAHHCQALLAYVIDPDKCRGCTACARVCPGGAISGTVKQAHVIDTSKCLKCGACIEKCRFGAISKQ